MPYTFGAGTGDDITWSILGSLSGSGASGIVCGWWYPTTLTATRGLWSCGNTFGAEIDTTTSELRLRTDNTTDGQWTTTGAGLTVNQWQFLAFMATCNNTGPAAAWRVWSGTVNSAPIECTVTNAVAPVGNFVVNGNFYIGNKGTGTLAFQGDVGDVMYHSTNAGAGASTHPYTLAAIGAISNAEAAFTYERFVLPAWLGKGFAPDGAFRRNGVLNGTNDDMAYACTTNLFQVRRAQNVNATAFSGVTPTINGATWSQNGSPRSLVSYSPYMPGVRR